MKEMDIAWPDFLEQQFEIVQAYDRLGIESTLSCTPYDRGIEIEGETASWAESNAVCYTNTWTSLITNRESGLSALATALTGYAPKYGLHLLEHRVPNTVSYTHLRAHETDSYLVCRLLLEKKSPTRQGM